MYHPRITMPDIYRVDARILKKIYAHDQICDCISSWVPSRARARVTD